MLLSDALETRGCLEDFLGAASIPFFLGMGRCSGQGSWGGLMLLSDALSTFACLQGKPRPLGGIVVRGVS
jgi:hypothetical protein